MLFTARIGKQEHKALQSRACDRMVRRTCTRVHLVTILIVQGILLIAEKREALTPHRPS